MQGGTEMAFNPASTVELNEQDKVTIFAPEDAALAAAPATNDTSDVRSLVLLSTIVHA